jgi:UDP:flavonoid glycosyltransferase YjiC (YdhE family)
MPKLLIAWEIAGGLGHLVQIAPVAQALRARGHDIALACGDVAAATRFNQPQKLFSRIDAAPRANGPDPVKGPTPRSYADILHYWGFHSGEALRELIARWQPLVAQADAVLCHHAPSAQAAALLLQKPVVRFGDGYTVPPATAPLSMLTHWNPEPATDLAVKEARLQGVLQSAGIVCANVGAFLGMVPDFLTTWPFLDHYPARPNPFYYGPLMTDAGAALPHWPQAPGPKLLAYLFAGHPGLPKLFEALERTGWPCCLYSAGPLPPAPSNVVIAPEPFAMTQAVAMADIIVGHASHGTSAQAIRAGKPLVLLPNSAEQSMVAWRLATLGVGLPAPSPFNAAGIEQALHAVAADPAFAARAQSLSAMVAAYDADAAAAELAEDMCAALFDLR